MGISNDCMCSYIYIYIYIYILQKPDDWLDDEPRYIPDPKAVKPDDWDDEEDGEWEPPQIGNTLVKPQK